MDRKRFGVTFGHMVIFEPRIERIERIIVGKPTMKVWLPCFFSIRMMGQDSWLGWEYLRDQE
jgi:hypothetical protein